MKEEEVPDQVRLDIRVDETWSARRLQHRPEEKHLMAEYFASHEFLVSDGCNPEVDQRETVSSVLVNQGTTPNVIAEGVLEWVKKNQDRGLFDITWYTPGHLIPSTLRDFRMRHPHLAKASQLFLFPGSIDLDMETVAGPEAERFVEELDRCFAYAFLSAHAFDIQTGTTYFHRSGEVRIQRACAQLYAAEKFLFLDSTKFKREGDRGYTIWEILRTAKSVAIYTVSSEKDDWLKAMFAALSNSLLTSAEAGVWREDLKSLRLRIVGCGGASTSCLAFTGLLTDSP